MTLKSCLAAIGLIIALGSARAAPMECPAKSHQMDDIIASLQAARGCDAAMKVFEACEYGASGDVQFGAVVEQKCEADFRALLKTSLKHTYQHELQTCDRKYQNESGTMYRSFTAFCRAKVAQRWSARGLKAARARIAR